MKLEALSDSQIAKQFKNDNRFGGVLNKADLSKLDTKCYVFNLDKRNGPGSHWTCLSNMNPVFVFYCDSFAQPPPEHVLKLMKMTGKRLIMNTKQ